MIYSTQNRNFTDSVSMIGAKLALICGLLAVLPIPAWSQSASRPDRGVRPVGSYSVSDIENISLTNGNVNLSIPLASLPPVAGGSLNWTIRAEYSGKLWDRTGMEVYMAPPLSNYTHSTLQLGDGGGWRVGAMYWLTVHHRNEDYMGLPPQGEQDPDWYLTGYSWKMILTTPDGAKHELRPVDYPSYPFGQGNHDYQRGFYKDTPAANSVNATMRYYSYDGSWLWAKIDPFPAFGGPQSWSVYLPDGTIVEHSNGIQRIRDTSGNKIKIWSDVAGSVTTTHYQDEGTGREIKYVYNSATNTGQAQYQTVGGSWVSIDVNYGTTWVHGLTYLVGDPCMTELEVNTEVPVIRSIVYPQTKPGAARLQYTFSYNSDTSDSTSLSRRTDCSGGYVTINNPSHGWGSLSQMVTPLGATVNYSYQWDGTHWTDFDPNLVTREPVTQKSVTHDSVTDTWNYTLSPAAGLAISGSVTGPDGSMTTELFYPTDPGQQVFHGGAGGKGGLVYRTVRARLSGQTSISMITTERHWTRLVFSGGDTAVPGGDAVFNPVVDAEYTTLHDSGGAAVKMSARTFQHDYNGNVIATTEYDWFSPSLVSRDAQGVPTGVPGGATVLRTTTSNYHHPAPTSTSTNVYAKRALATGTPLILSALQDTTTGPSQTRYCYDSQAYGAPPTTGDLTEEHHWDNINNKWLITKHTYDSYGNKTKTESPNGVETTGDPNDFITKYFYDDATHANLTRTVVNPGNSPATEQTTTMVYDYSTGMLLSTTDPNGAVTETSYTNQLLGTPDPYLRPGIVTGPSVTSYVNGVSYTNQRHKVKTTYDDNARQTIVESDLNTEGDYKLKTRTTTDQMGRAVLVERNEDGTANYTITSQTVYVQMGKITLVSTPRRSAGETSDGWKRTTADELGRVVELATFTGAAQPPNTGTNGNHTGSITTSFYANETTVTDQAGKSRRSVTDALGRLAQVIEDPGGAAYLTTYQYDSRGNLTQTSQTGVPNGGSTSITQTRTFTYDSLSRLISADNPESGIVSYEYDADSNLKKKTDARGYYLEYAYDGLNRNTTINYSDTAINPDITRYYDGATNGKGRFWYDYAGGDYSNGQTVEHKAIDSYDLAGRPLVQRQHFKTGGVWSGAYQTERKYDLAGNTTWQQYPSTRTVSYGFDNAGRLSTFSGALGDGVNRNYVLGVTYNAANQMRREHFGTVTQLYHHLHYTSRGQLYDTRVGTGATDDFSNSTWNRGGLRIFYNSSEVFGNGGANINGNVWRLDHFVPTSEDASQSSTSVDYFNYDALNRITSISEHTYYSNAPPNYSTFTQQYVYDRFGNRTVNNAVSNVPGVFNQPFNVEGATNRLLAPNGTISYDAAGNQINDGYSGNGSRTYDAENRVLTAQGTNGSNSFAYNADGRRVRRVNGATTTLQVFGMGGELLAEYTPSAPVTAPTKEYGYRGGQLLITAEGSNLKWLVGDQLGTARIVLDKSGRLTDDVSTTTIFEGVIHHDYLPFGEEIGAGVGNRSADNGYVADGVRQKFTSKERDSETGLDYFEARYYSSVQGRFTSPDEFTGGPDELFDFAEAAEDNPTFYADPENPQSLNKYQYTYNSPVALTDPDGHCPICVVAFVAAVVAIATGPSTVNAPGPRDPVYKSEGPGPALASALTGGKGGAGGPVAMAGVPPTKQAIAPVVKAVVSTTRAKSAPAKNRILARVAEMKNKMTPQEKGRTTFAAAEVKTKQGKTETWVSAAGKRGDVPKRIAGDAKVVKSPGASQHQHLPHINDAERALDRAARREGAKIKAIKATRDICDNCREALKKSGSGGAIVE